MKHGLLTAIALLAFLWPRGAYMKQAKKGVGSLFLFDSATNQSSPVTGTPRPNRIHVRFSPEFSDWVFVLSDIRGRFPEPLEVFVAGSVVSGEQVGSASSTQNYVFLSGGRWVPTREPRQLKLIVLGEIPSYKTVTFEPASDSRVEFVNTDRKFNFKTYDPYASR